MPLQIYILDRKHDENALFRFIADELQDTFVVIRLKASRNSTETTCDEMDNDRAVKFLAMTYPEQAIKHLTKIHLGKKVLQYVRLILDYGTVVVDGHSYCVVRAEYHDRARKPLFDKPMLLITNLRLDTLMCSLIFRLYSLRGLIEEVFHFLKTSLGWEDISSTRLAEPTDVTHPLFLYRRLFLPERIGIDQQSEYRADLRTRRRKKSGFQNLFPSSDGGLDESTECPRLFPTQRHQPGRPRCYVCLCQLAMNIFSEVLGT